MKKQLIAILTICLFLISCRHTGTFMKPPINEPSDDAAIRIAEAAASVSDSMLEIARIEKTVIPTHTDNTMSIPNAYNLQARASVDWAGPIDEVTRRIAAAGHYRVRVLGQAPAVPILISLNVKDNSLAEILRNIDYQAGEKASLHVYPNSQTVEIRYAKIYA